MIAFRSVGAGRTGDVRLRPIIVLTLIAVLSSLPRAWAQDPDKNPADKKLGWTNSSDFSLVITSGNSATQTLGLSDQLRHTWPAARFSFDATGVFSNTSDDWFFQVDPGLQFPVGAPPQNPSTTLMKPEPSTDVSKFLLSGQFDRNITPRFFWSVGASWDHNRDAGIIRRYIAFAGVGHTWADTQRRRVSTTYSLSYTDRKEDKPDPEKEPRFAGARLGWTYTEHFSKSTRFDSDLSSNIDLSDAADYSVQTTNALSVAMNSRLSLKVSLQWLFENQPALDTGLDIVAYLELVNPDGIPSSGDEYYRTVSSGPTKLVIGSADARKEKLDTIFRTALVIKF